MGSAMMILLSQCTTTKKTEPKKETPIDLSNVSYETHVKPIMADNCIGCHSGQDAAHDLRLETYLEVKTAIGQHHLLDRIHSEDAPMPPGNLMPVLEQDIIDHWVKNGYKE